MSKIQITLVSLLGGVACFAAGFFVSRAQTKGENTAETKTEAKAQTVAEAKPRGRFKAQTRFAILRGDTAVLGEPAPKTEPESEAIWLRSQVKMVSSRQILLRVVKRLNLESAWNLPGGADAAADTIEKRLEMELENGTSIVTLRMWGDKLVEIADIANTVREAYEEYRMEASEEQYRRLSQSSDAVIKTYTEEVERKRLDFGKVVDKYDARNRFFPADSEQVRLDQVEIAGAKKILDSAQTILNAAREVAARQKVEFGVVKKPIEVLEIARPPLP